MMKKLILVRHGKAEDAPTGISDFERSLTGKGKIISRLMARKLREILKPPVTIISSPAFRALETALIFALEFGVEPDKVILSSDIYYKMQLKYLPGILALAGENNSTIMLFGHNPSFTDIAGILTAEGCDSISKSGIALISFNVRTWQEIKPKSGKLEFYLNPERNL